MPAAFQIDPARTAVLSMDCQTGIVSIYTKDDKDAFLVRAASVLNHARAAGMTIIHVQVGFRPGLPRSAPETFFSAPLNPPRSIKSCFRSRSAQSHLSLPRKRAKSLSPSIASALSPAPISP